MVAAVQQMAELQLQRQQGMQQGIADTQTKLAGAASSTTASQRPSRRDGGGKASGAVQLCVWGGRDGLQRFRRR